MQSAHIKDHLRENHRFFGRAVVSGAFVLLLLTLVLVRLAKLQIVDHAHYKTLSQDNRVKLVPLPPTRGLIYDRAGRVLAQNRPSYSLEITPEKVTDIEQTIGKLA